jgi:spermidine synthase
MIDLLHRLRAAYRGVRMQSRFRDPMVDFRLSEDRVQSFAEPHRSGVRGPYLFEQGNYVSLHMAGDTASGVQALMDRNMPERLVLTYTEIMAGFTRFHDSPRTIGMIGLGGGSLAKHCHRTFPESRILVAEISSEVIAMRREFFIPDDDTRFEVLHLDGAELIRERAGAFDVLLVDAFDELGYPSHLATRSFYRDCRRALTNSGVLVINFSGKDWEKWFLRLDSVFRGRSVLYQCPDGDNVIAFLTRSSLPDWVTQSIPSKWNSA